MTDGVDGDDEREYRWFEAIARTVGDGIYQLDTEGRFVRVNQTVADVTGYSRAELIGESASLVLTDESYRRTTETILELLRSEEDAAFQEMTVLTADGEELPVENRLALLWDDGEFRGTAGIVRDVSGRERRERQLEAQRDELARLDRINGVIRDTIRALVSASSREDIAETVCERLAASRAYLAAWIGDYSPAGREIVPLAAAGVDAAAVDRHLETTGGDGGAHDESPFRTGRVAVSDVPRDDPIRGALGDGRDPALAAIPLVYGETVYSVLSVYTDRATGFGEGEVEVLQELGETIGLAVNALETKRLLDADTITELEFEFDDPSVFAVEATERLGCRMELEGITSGADGELLVYASVTGADSERVRQLAVDHPAIADATIVAGDDDGGLLLLSVTGRTPLAAVREAGGRIERATVEEGRGRLLVAVAAEADTRRAVELFQRAFPDARLVSQLKVERSVQTPRAFRRQVLDGLTEKQRRALEAAYYGDYFERPRSITGTELAASLGITPSTFHQHLQAGLGKVLAAVFEGRRRRRGSGNHTNEVDGF